MKTLKMINWDVLALWIVSAACWGTAIVAVLSVTGCSVFNPEGFEIGGKVGMYAVHDRQVTETTSTKKRPMVCWLRNCDENGNVIQGS